jgi:Ni,Fe-hydrogenase III component G
MMQPESTLQAAEALLARWSAGLSAPRPNRRDVIIEAGELLDAVRALTEAHWGYLSAITGHDCGETADAIELLYHFCSGALVVTLRVRIARISGVLPSVCPLIPVASVFEREIAEMFGVTFAGAPDTARLYLSEDWPEGVYPLLKDAPIMSPEGQPKE